MHNRLKLINLLKSFHFFIACGCNAIGSKDLQCSSAQCMCHEGYAGEKCQECSANFRRDTNGRCISAYFLHYLLWKSFIFTLNFVERDPTYEISQGQLNSF